MDLMQIAAIALDEAAIGAEGVARKDNGDGTVDLTFSFTFDPKVVAERAKAMPKGVKRGDLSDDLGESADDYDAYAFADDVDDDDNGSDSYADGESEEEEEEEDEGDAQDAADEGIRADSVFLDALDSIDGVEGDAEDARQNSRHSQTPLENCRARDPRFCRYHGDKAWKNYIEEALKIKGLSGSVDVGFDSGSSTYSVKISGVSQGDEQAVGALVNDCLSEKGVKNATNGGVSGSGSGNATAGGSFQQEWGMTDRTGRINEWVDDYLVEYASDPNAEIDLDDLSALLETQEDIDEVEGRIRSAVSQSQTPDPNDVTKLKELHDDAEKKYHTLIAQQYFKDVKTQQEAQNKSDDIDKEYQTSYDSVHKRKDEVDAAKMAIFGSKKGPKGPVCKTPPGFGAAHPWWEKYSKTSSSIFQWNVRDYDMAVDEFSDAESKSDLKMMRAGLASMDYKKDNFANAVPGYEAAADKFMRELYDWASTDPTYSANVATAFPNGRPK